MTEISKIDNLKEMLLNAEKKLDIERSDENFEKSRSEGFEILRKALRGDLQNSDKDFGELWIEGFRVLRKILKEDPQCSEEVVIILENTEEQKRKIIWRYVALLSIQISEIDPNNKSANKLLEEVVHFLDKIEKDEWKEYWSLVLHLSRDTLSKDPKNEAAEKLSIKAEEFEKEEEKVMQNSAIDLSIQQEEEESRVDLPVRKKENEKKIQKIKLPPGVRLSMSGEWRWRGIKDHLGLQKVGLHWLPSKGTNLHKRNMLLDAKENLLADPSDLPDQDQAIIVKNLLDPANEWLNRKIEEESHQMQTKELGEYSSTEKSETSIVAPVATIDVNTEEEELSTVSDKLHIAYIDKVHQKYQKPKQAWLELGTLADKSKGTQLVDVPGFSEVYLKRDFFAPTNKLRYQYGPFRDRNEGKIINKATFDSAWQRKKMEEKKSK